MKIQFKSFFSTLSGSRPIVKDLDLPAGTTPAQIIKEMGIDDHDGIIILINGRPSNENTVLKDGEILTFMPPVSAA